MTNNTNEMSFADILKIAPAAHVTLRNSKLPVELCSTNKFLDHQVRVGKLKAAFETQVENIDAKQSRSQQEANNAEAMLNAARSKAVDASAKLTAFVANLSNEPTAKEKSEKKKLQDILAIANENLDIETSKYNEVTKNIANDIDAYVEEHINKELEKGNKLNRLKFSFIKLCVPSLSALDYESAVESNDNYALTPAEFAKLYDDIVELHEPKTTKAGN